MLRRSRRVIRKPVLYQPVETVLEDDYAANEYDSDLDSDTDIDTDDECVSDDDFEEEDDADDNGNLKDFIVDDESESEEEDA
jgi:hypothetical protein|tara:strand:+ start:461 stop:706 length:246 start_codon:yes stop_codon:yes gene_type:complete